MRYAVLMAQAAQVSEAQVRKSLQWAVRWIVAHEDMTVPDKMHDPEQYLATIPTVALVAALYEVRPRTVARKVWATWHKVQG